MKNMNKLLSLVLILALSVIFIPACSDGISEDISDPALVSKVTQYDRDYSSEEVAWTEQASYEYEYKDAYPVSMKMTEQDNVFVSDFAYEFKDGTPVSMTRYDAINDYTVKTSYTESGQADRILTFDSTDRKIGEKVFQYGSRDEYFTLVLHENIISPPEETVVDHMEEIDSIIITSEDGLLRQTVNDGLYANYNDEEEKVWARFDGSYTANYAENGILDNTTAIFATFPGSGNQYKFDLTVEDGRVSEVIRNYWVPAEGATEGTDEGEAEGMWEPECRFVFEYTDTEISQSRYASMINYFILDGGSNYYIYNWY